MSLGVLGVGLLVALLAGVSRELWDAQREAQAALRTARFHDALNDLLLSLDRADFSSRAPAAVAELRRFASSEDSRAGDLDALDALLARSPMPRDEIRSALLAVRRGESRADLRARDPRILPAVIAIGALLGLSLAGASALLLGKDLARRNEADALLREMAIVDDLTGLYNRRGFIARATDLLALARRMEHPAIVFLADVDGLKTINDRLGHASGDLALAGAARVLQLTFRNSDVIARVGGDEFAVLALVDSRDDGEGILRRVQKNVDFWNGRSSQPFDVSLSTGLVAIDPSETSLESLLARADRVMYEKKEARRTGPA